MAFLANAINLLAGGPNLLAWIVLGGLAGWIAGNIMRGSGYGCLANVILGIIGALVGGEVMSFFVTGNYSFIPSLIIAVLGAVIVIGLARIVFGYRKRAGA